MRDGSLKRELQRLNLEMPSLSFFDLRDRAIAWMGNGPQKAHLRETPVVRETVTSEDKVLNLLQQQGKRLNDQQTQIESLLKRLEAMTARRPPLPRRTMTCFLCNSPEHFKRNCPQLPNITHHQPSASRQPHQPSNQASN